MERIVNKKEIRVYFNLENEQDKELYNLLMSKDKASSYIKEYMKQNILDRSNNNGAIIAALNNINDTLKNITINTNTVINNSEVDDVQSTLASQQDVKEMVIEIDDLDF